MPGHGMADCPVAKDDSEHVFNMCFKCGSTEHKSSLCTAKLTQGNKETVQCFLVSGEFDSNVQCWTSPWV